MTSLKRSPKLIKNYGAKIISYGLIALGIVLVVAVAIIRPNKSFSKDLFNYSQNPKLTNFSSPFSQSITITESKPSYIEFRFEDDSIEKHRYVVTLAHDSKTIFEYEYAGTSIFRIPIDDKGLKPDDVVNLEVKCLDSCEDVKINLYDIDGKKYPKMLIAGFGQDISMYWYGAFAAAIGLTLLPLSKEQK